MLSPLRVSKKSPRSSCPTWRFFGTRDHNDSGTDEGRLDARLRGFPEICTPYLSRQAARVGAECASGERTLANSWTIFTVRHLIQKVLSQFRLDGIRGQILILAVLAALIPSLSISLIAYAQSRRALTEKITQELMTTGSQAGREADVWLKERLYDLRVFANSSVVSETVARPAQPGPLVGYLNSVRSGFAAYEELHLVDENAGLVAGSMRRATPVRLQEAWEKSFKSSRNLVGEPYWDETAQKMIVILGVPVLQADGRVAGALVARASF